MLPSNPAIMYSTEEYRVFVHVHNLYECCPDEKKNFKSTPGVFSALAMKNDVIPIITNHEGVHHHDLTVPSELVRVSHS